MSNPPVKERAQSLIDEADALFERGEISEAEWHARMAAVITPAYLGASNPRAGSGHSGDEAGWEYARGLIAGAISHDGSFLDIGCANGHLIESLRTWCPFAVEYVGLDISAELVELARARVPGTEFQVGNGMTWSPSRKFDFVRTGLEYVPTSRRKDYVARLLRDLVAPDGALLIGVFNEERELATMAENLAAWGFAVAQRLERPHRRDERLAYRLLKIRNSTS